MQQRTIRLIKIAQRQLTIADSDYRAMLHHLTGKSSSTLCTLPQLNRVLRHLQQQGFVLQTKSQPAADHGTKPTVTAARQKRLDKIEAILADAKRPWAYAEALAARMFNRQRIEWLTSAELTKLLQALIIDQQRRGTYGSAKG